MTIHICSKKLSLEFVSIVDINDVDSKIFFSVFTSNCTSHTTQFTESKGRDWENEELPTVGDKVRDNLRNLKVHKSVGPDEMHSSILRELADEATKLLSVISEKLWQTGEVPSD